MKNNTIQILGIDFYKGRVKGVVESLKSGGLLVVPAAPALKTIKTDTDYYKSLLVADIVIPDSGYMALIWNLTHADKVRRISGLEFLIAFFEDKDVLQTKDILLVDPRPKEAESNLTYLRKIGFNVGNDVSYLAPMYDKNNVIDPVLLSLIEQRKPKYVIVNLGGGTQEKLGAYLKQNLSYSPGIICTGAAIAFLTGQQARIPNWADKLYMGWLFRCIEKPKLYIPRYLSAFKLITIMLQYGKKQPSLN